MVKSAKKLGDRQIAQDIPETIMENADVRRMIWIMVIIASCSIGGASREAGWFATYPIWAGLAPMVCCVNIIYFLIKKSSKFLVYLNSFVVLGYCIAFFLMQRPRNWEIELSVYVCILALLTVYGYYIKNYKFTLLSLMLTCCLGWMVIATL